MAVKQLAHICLHVKDVQKTTDFYSRILGLPVKFRFFRESGEVRGAYLEAGGETFIEFFVAGKERSGESPMVHMCLQVDSIEKTIADIRARGGEVSDKKLGADHSWQAWTMDPDGVRIELHEYTAESSQYTGKDLTVSW